MYNNNNIKCSRESSRGGVADGGDISGGGGDDGTISGATPRESGEETQV